MEKAQEVFSIDIENKYVVMMAKRLKKELDHWSVKGTITEKEMYRLLHDVKGTAGTIGLPTLSNMAIDLLESIEENSSIKWSIDEWQTLFKPMIELTNAVEQDTFEERDRLANEIRNKEREVAKEESNSQLEKLEGVMENPVEIKRDERVVLLIDEDIDFVRYLIDRLEKEHFHVLIARTIHRGLDLFYTMRPSFVMLNNNFIDNDSNSVEQLLQVAQQTVVPVAIVSDQGSHVKRIKAYEMGANDFIMKPIEEEVFMPYLRNRLRWKQDIHQMITVDELTGVFNRKYMEQVLTARLNEFERYNTPFALVMLDLDHFKRVNDTYGHLVGDEVLKRLAVILRRHSRKKDNIFRYGGEEFSLIMAETTIEEAYAVVEEMRIAFHKEVFRFNDETFRVTFSAGISVIDDATETKESIISEADQALYRSKETGRNSTTIYNGHSRMMSTRTLNVLIVDDDPLVRSVLARGFTKWVPKQDVAVNVREYEDGLQFLNSGWYNPSNQYVLLLDGIMPKIDGIEVLTRVREHYPEKNVVITMLSARSDEENVIRALEVGADDYLLKPFNLAEVIARIERLVQRMLF